MKLAEVLKEFTGKRVTVSTREDEYTGLLQDVGEDYIRLIDGKSDCILNLSHVESVTEG